MAEAETEDLEGGKPAEMAEEEEPTIDTSQMIHEDSEEIVQMMGNRYLIRKEIFRKAAFSFYRLELWVHFIPLMFLQFVVGVISGIIQTFEDQKNVLKWLNFANLALSSATAIWTGMNMKLAFGEKKQLYKNLAKKYDFLLNEVFYRRTVYKKGADHSDFFKWAWNLERDIKEETELIPEWMLKPIIRDKDNILARSAIVDPMPIPLPVKKRFIQPGLASASCSKPQTPDNASTTEEKFGEDLHELLLPKKDNNEKPSDD